MRGAIFILLATCSSQDERGTAVKPRPTPPEVAVATLSIDAWETTVFGAGPRATFERTTSKEHAAIGTLIPAMLDGAWSAAPPSPAIWQHEAHAARFRIESWTIDGEAYWALLEASGEARGAGAYIFRVAPRTEAERTATVLLQAPHGYYDVGTGRLAGELFFTKRDVGQRPRALFTNTIHRYQLAPGDKKKRKNHPADVAHNADHAFTVATDAFAIAAGNARVIQLHGFARADESDDDGDTSAIAMVVSAGDRAGSSLLTTAIAAAATHAFGRDVKRFPEETKLFGATTNVQGRLLRKHGRGDFVHVEMSADLRKRLRTSAELRAQLATVLFDTEPDKEHRK